MLIVELLIAFVLIVMLATGSDQLNGRVIAQAAILIALLVVVAYQLVTWLVGRIGRAPKAWLPSRRRIARAAAIRTRREAALDALDDAALERHLAKHPKDALAIEIRAERHRRAGDWPAYARDTEYLLTLRHGMDAEEEGSRRLELARVEEQLGRPERADALLKSIIERFPRHYQASLARERRTSRVHGDIPTPDQSGPEATAPERGATSEDEIWVRRRRGPRHWQT